MSPRPNAGGLGGPRAGKPGGSVSGPRGRPAVAPPPGVPREASVAPPSRDPHCPRSRSQLVCVQVGVWAGDNFHQMLAAMSPLAFSCSGRGHGSSVWGRPRPHCGARGPGSPAC